MTISYEDYVNQLKNASQNLLTDIESQRKNDENRLKTQTQGQIDVLNKNKNALNQTYTDNAKQAYQQRMIAQKNLPQQLAAQGYNGGLTESSNIKLESDYGNALNNYKRSYDNGVSAVDTQINSANSALAQSILSSNNAYGAKASDAKYNLQQQLAQAYANERARQLQEATAEKEQAYKLQLINAQKDADEYERLLKKLKEEEAAAAVRQKNAMINIMGRLDNDMSLRGKSTAKEEAAKDMTNAMVANGNISKNDQSIILGNLGY